MTGSSPLRAVPVTPARALGLIRVSKERTEMISPELQATAITDHCARRSYQLVAWDDEHQFLEGIDESGSRKKSAWWARLDQGIERLEAKQVDVLVVWRFDRTARNRLRWAVALDRVETAGGVLESATEPVDTSTPAGRFTRGMLGEMAAFRAEEIGATWREVHARRTGMGMPANGKPRFGYVCAPGGVHEPDPQTGPVLAALYRRYVSGESLYSLATWLNAERIPTVAGYSAGGPGPWTQRALRGMLDRGFGAGFITVHDQRVVGVHEAVVGEELWHAYLAARVERRTLRRVERSQYLLSGLVWCGCGAKMGGGVSHRPSQDGRTYVFFRCLASNAPGGPRHRGQNVRMAVVDSAVQKWLRGYSEEANNGLNARRVLAAAQTRKKVDAQTLSRELVALDQSLTRLEINRASDQHMPGSVYEAARDELLNQRRALEERLVTAKAELAAPERQRLAARLLDDWDILPVDQRRDGLRRMIERVVVTRTDRYGIYDVDVVPRGAA